MLCALCDLYVQRDSFTSSSAEPWRWSAWRSPRPRRPAVAAAALFHAAPLAGEGAPEAILNLRDVLEHPRIGRLFVALLDRVGDLAVRVAHRMLHAGGEIQAGDDFDRQVRQRGHQHFPPQIARAFRDDAVKVEIEWAVVAAPLERQLLLVDDVVEPLEIFGMRAARGEPREGRLD